MTLATATITNVLGIFEFPFGRSMWRKSTIECSDADELLNVMSLR